MEIVRTIVDDEPSEESTQESQPVSTGLREGVVYSPETMPDSKPKVSSSAEKPETPVTEPSEEKQDVPDDKLGSLDDEDLLKHEKVRRLIQSQKDREIAAERNRIAAQERQRVLDEIRAQREKEEIEQMSDEELGSYYRSKEQQQVYERQQLEKYWNVVAEQVAPQIQEQALNTFYQQGYQDVLAAVGKKAFDSVTPRVQSGELNTYKDIVAAIVEARIEDEVSKRAEKLAEKMYKGRIAAEHLNEEAPDTTVNTAGNAAVPYLRYSEISRWTPTQAARNADLLDAAERAGRILYNE